MIFKKNKKFTDFMWRQEGNKLVLTIYRAVAFCIILYSLFFILDSNAAFAFNNIYYSVGQDNAANLMTGTSTVTISSGIATFSAAQTGNIGVGDRVTYNTSDIAYISAKQSTTVWNVITAIGTTPPDIADSTVVSIKREYASLNAAEAGFTDVKHINDTDLTAAGADVAVNLACYYDTGPDTEAVNINFGTTDATHYLRIYTPNNTSTEVNQSQRHEGKWTDTKYRLEYIANAAYPTAIAISEDYVIIEGIQLKLTANSVSLSSGVAISLIGESNEIKINSNLFRGVCSGTSTDGQGIKSEGSAISKIYNNIFYNFFISGNNNRGISILDTGVSYIYNNTFYNNNIGVFGGSSAVTIAKNNISYNNTDNYSGAFSASSANNLSGPSQTDAPGSKAQQGAIVTFVSTTPGSEDFHLASTDTGARDYATDSVSEIGFIDDIDGQTRSTSLPLTQIDQVKQQIRQTQLKIIQVLLQITKLLQQRLEAGR